jgi:hypothetical protein
MYCSIAKRSIAIYPIHILPTFSSGVIIYTISTCYHLVAFAKYGIIKRATSAGQLLPSHRIGRQMRCWSLIIPNMKKKEKIETQSKRNEGNSGWLRNTILELGSSRNPHFSFRLCFYMSCSMACLVLPLASFFFKYRAQASKRPAMLATSKCQQQ